MGLQKCGENKSKPRCVGILGTTNSPKKERKSSRRKQKNGRAEGVFEPVRCLFPVPTRPVVTGRFKFPLTLRKASHQIKGRPTSREVKIIKSPKWCSNLMPRFGSCKRDEPKKTPGENNAERGDAGKKYQNSRAEKPNSHILSQRCQPCLYRSPSDVGSLRL